MITVKQLAQQVYGIAEVAASKCREVGKRLKKAGISTVRISGVTYIDVPESETIFSIFSKVYGQQVPARGVCASMSAGIGKTGILPTAPAEYKAEEPAITIERLVKTVEKMATLLAEKDSIIMSLQVKLATKNHRQFSDVVKRAVAVYGD